ncbi:hypothetical protein FA95DRAFT_1608972, partial [Auriscalpium vulgare]
KGFKYAEERVRKGAEKLNKFLNAKQQGRLDGFFTVQPKTSPKKDGKKTPGKKTDKKDAKGGKRKADDAKESSSSKKTKTKK